MKHLLILSFIALAFVGCDKNQKAIKRLDGKWSATSYVYMSDGKTEDVIGHPDYNYEFQMDFNDCKLKDDEFCSGTWTEIFEGDAETIGLNYRVVNYGNSLEFQNPKYPADLLNFNIEEFDKENLKLFADYGDGDNVTITLKKM